MITCKKTRLYGYAYDFSVDYDNIDVNDVLDIHKDLMKKHDINWFRFIRKMYMGLLSLSFGRSLTCDGIKCVPSKNWPCQARPTLFWYKLQWASLLLIFLLLLVSWGSCNTIDDPYALICVQDKLKHMNVKVFGLMSGVKEIWS